MRVLALADEECMELWDHYVPGRLDGYDLILACGDLHAAYLSFVVTMARCPVLYVHGNHDIGYEINPPEGCDCIDGRLVNYKGLRILGLGGCRRYRPGAHQYTDKQMRWRVLKLAWEILKAGGVDVVVTHAPPRGVGDAGDLPHRGFEAFLELMDRTKPQFLLHGHIHLRYGLNLQREHRYKDTRVINCCQRFAFEVEPGDAKGGVWRKILGIFPKNKQNLY